MKKNQNDVNIHAGHRERVRKRIEKGGFECLSDVEALEYILFFAIPRGDTNLLAHLLLRKFHSFMGVMKASKWDLMTVDGIGEKSAELISSYLPMFKRYHFYSTKANGEMFTTTGKIIDYFKSEMLGNTVEFSYAMYLDTSLRLINVVQFVKGTFNETMIFVDQVVREAVTLNARYVVVAHNHTSGNVFPSEADCETAVHVYRALEIVNKTLSDFVIIDNLDSFSFAEAGIITEDGILNVYQQQNRIQNVFERKNAVYPYTVQDEDEF